MLVDFAHFSSLNENVMYLRIKMSNTRVRTLFQNEVSDIYSILFFPNVKSARNTYAESHFLFVLFISLLIVGV